VPGGASRAERGGLRRHVSLGAVLGGGETAASGVRGAEVSGRDPDGVSDSRSAGIALGMWVPARGRVTPWAFAGWLHYDGPWTRHRRACSAARRDGPEVAMGDPAEPAPTPAKFDAFVSSAHADAE